MPYTYACVGVVKKVKEKCKNKWKHSAVKQLKHVAISRLEILIVGLGFVRRLSAHSLV